MNTSQATSETAPTKEVPLWTWPYILVCLSTFLGYVNYAMFNPTLPKFVSALGASSLMVGLTYAAFSGASFLIRPVVGRFVDTGSPRLILGVGSLLVGLGSIPCLFPNLGAIFAGRTIQGFGWSGLNVGSSSLVAVLAPPSRRGESSGYFQTAIRIGTGLFAPFGIWLMTAANFPTVVIVATIAGSL